MEGISDAVIYTYGIKHLTEGGIVDHVSIELEPSSYDNHVTIQERVRKGERKVVFNTAKFAQFLDRVNEKRQHILNERNFSVDIARIKSLGAWIAFEADVTFDYEDEYAIRISEKDEDDRLGRSRIQEGRFIEFSARGLHDLMKTNLLIKEVLNAHCVIFKKQVVIYFLCAIYLDGFNGRKNYPRNEQLESTFTLFAEKAFYATSIKEEEVKKFSFDSMDELYSFVLRNKSLFLTLLKILLLRRDLKCADV